MLFIYNETCGAFLKSITVLAHEIIEKELNLTIKKRRVHFNNYLFPLQFVLFERHHELGFYDPKGFTIGLHKKLMYEARREVVKNILRHELCHYVASLKYPSMSISPHGKEFRDIARSFGYGPEVYAATCNLNSANQIEDENANENINDTQSEKIILKVKKLLSLATSHNEHEAAQATMRANELLLRHHLEHINTHSNNKNMTLEDTTCMMRVLTAKRMGGLERAIADILETCLVKTVFSGGGEGIYLEVIGERVNVEMASYFTDFLIHELNFLYKKVCKENPGLKGIRGKNSFFHGISKGFLEKIHESQANLGSAHSHALISQDLDKRMKIVYPRLSTKIIQAKNSQEALELGRSVGQNLNLRRGLTQSTSEKTLSLGM